MEISKIKLYDGVCHVIFTGPNYFFHSSFYGYIARAERLASADGNTEEFVIYSGNARFPDGIEEDWFALAEKFIKRNEQRFLPKTCKFERKTVDLNKCLVTVSYDLDRFK